jgi:hypothetical protein
MVLQFSCFWLSLACRVRIGRIAPGIISEGCRKGDEDAGDAAFAGRYSGVRSCFSLVEVSIFLFLPFLATLGS